MDAEELEQEVKRLDIKGFVVEMDLRATQMTLLRLMMFVNPTQAPKWKAAFVERRRELIERLLIQFEESDPAMAAQIQESLEDDFEDWLEPNRDAE
jgi:phage regulator Rha-like protein